MSTFHESISLKLCREVPWIKKSDVLTEFFRICPTSGFMDNFWFRLVFQISRYTIDQSKLGIPQIEAMDRIKIFYFESLELGSLGVFGVIWDQNQNIYKARQIIYQNEALGPVIEKKWFSRSFEVI